MIPYGMRKMGSSQQHPHNKCECIDCGLRIIVKKRERVENKQYVIKRNMVKEYGEE